MTDLRSQLSRIVGATLRAEHEGGVAQQCNLILGTIKNEEHDPIGFEHRQDDDLVEHAPEAPLGRLHPRLFNSTGTGSRCRISQKDPREPREDPKGPHGTFTGPPGDPKQLPQGLRVTPRDPQETSKGRKRDPKGRPRDPKGSQEDPQGPPSDPKGPPKDLQGNPRTKDLRLKTNTVKPQRLPLAIEGDLQGREGQAECVKR